MRQLLFFGVVSVLGVNGGCGASASGPAGGGNSPSATEDDGGAGGARPPGSQPSPTPGASPVGVNPPPTADGAARTTPPTSDAGANRGAEAGAVAVAADAAPAGDGSCQGAIVCDDFEANIVGRTPAMWSAAISPSAAGTVRVDEVRAFSGTKSVHISTPAAGRGQAFFSRALAALPDNAFFGRMMIWVSATPKNVHWDNIRGSGKLPGTNQQAWYNYGGGGSGTMMANYYTTGSDCWKTSKSLLPVGRWACVEWRYDGTKNEMYYWLDGRPVTDLTVIMKGDGCSGTNLWRAPTFDRLSLGWYNAQTSSIPIDMWIDDVAVDTKQIGCPPMR